MRLDRRASEMAEEQRWIFGLSTSLDQTLIDVALQRWRKPHPATTDREMHNSETRIVLMATELDRRHRRRIVLGQEGIDCGVDLVQGVGHVRTVANESQNVRALDHPYPTTPLGTTMLEPEGP